MLSFTNAQSAAELFALASRGEGSVTITKTKTSTTTPVNLSPGDMVDVPGPVENATIVTTAEPIPINDSTESAHVVSPDSYRTSGSISYLLRGRKENLPRDGGKSK